MRVVFQEYWEHIREGMEQAGVPLPPHDLDAFLDEMKERGVGEVRLCLRWLHILDVEAAGGNLPASDAFARSPFLQYGTYALITTRTPDGTVFEYRQRHLPEDGQPFEFLAALRERLEAAGLRVLSGRWQY